MWRSICLRGRIRLVSEDAKGDDGHPTSMIGATADTMA
jgi:hypothetical protein